MGFEVLAAFAAMTLAPVATATTTAATPAAAPVLRAPWVSCAEAEHAAYRTVSGALNPHNAFAHPVRAPLASGQTCQDLK